MYKTIQFAVRTVFYSGVFLALVSIPQIIALAAGAPIVY
ncbi:hypothetical protein AARI_20400 [Glutamicibacter arilaitensis Re117]|uniref:Uncharacterized protein n=1 Tax=Glutamicibacter arilaitensis (strain DSM 16368 / CIP 108037 / IAM 15318 / JCM 13566 / NCIMB 14258 / Re117) TaxID=861360 RepID=A0ABM9PY58_GLUAR|nr:hypothetical protein AARI_20400 [Glutamicibacter arilaitensis Re117]